MKTVAVYSGDIIRPGGGPSGYVYNLQLAAKKYGTINEFRFIGRIVDQRIAVGGKAGLFTKIGEWLRVTFPNIYIPTPSKRKLLRQLDGVDVAVIHIPLHSDLIWRIKKKVASLIYMPHSPSIISDEYMMDVSSSKRRLNYKYFMEIKWREHACLSYADKIVFPSENAMLAYRRAYPDIIDQGKHHFIFSGVDFEINESEIFSSSPERTSSKIRVAFIGRFNSHKGFDLFCNAAQKLAALDVEFVAAGAGAFPVDKYPVKNLGWREDIKSVLLGVDIVVVPNRVAYFDLLPLEAASAGRPIVFTPVGGNLDQARLMIDSVVSDSVSIDDLVAGISKAIEMKKKNKDWGASNRQAYLKHFSGSAFVRRWDEFICGL